jgi:hypothetical protein
MVPTVLARVAASKGAAGWLVATSWVLQTGCDWLVGSVAAEERTAFSELTTTSERVGCFGLATTSCKLVTTGFKLASWLLRPSCYWLSTSLLRVGCCELAATGW